MRSRSGAPGVGRGLRGAAARVCSRVTLLRLGRSSVTLLRCGRGPATASACPPGGLSPFAEPVIASSGARSAPGPVWSHFRRSCGDSDHRLGRPPVASRGEAHHRCGGLVCPRRVRCRFAGSVDSAKCVRGLRRGPGRGRAPGGHARRTGSAPGGHARRAGTRAGRGARQTGSARQDQGSASGHHCAGGRRSAARALEVDRSGVHRRRSPAGVRLGRTLVDTGAPSHQTAVDHRRWGLSVEPAAKHPAL